MNTNQSDHNYQTDRRNGRIIAFQALFSLNFSDTPPAELLKFGWLDKKYSARAIKYATFLIKGTLENLKTIDEMIQSKLRNWNYDRISNIDRAILRFSVFSLVFEKELSKKIIINEAIEIVKLFGSEDSHKFINGILDAIKRSEEQS